jgi:hypothetical protein
MRYTMLLCLLTLALALPAAAQTDTPAPITEFQLLILPGTGDPATSTPVQTTTTTIGPTANCGLAPSTNPPPTGTVINPGLYELNDPYTAGRVCRMAFPQAVPAGSYQWAGVLIAASCNPTGSQVISPCPSPRTVGVPPFSIVNRILRPPAPTGLRLTQ